MRKFLTIVFCFSALGTVQAQESPSVPAETPLERLSAEDHFKSGTAALEAGQTKASIRHLGEAVRLKPDFREAWYNLALAYSRTSEIKAEEAAYLQAIKLDPDYTKAYYNLGICYEEAGRLREAADSYQRVVELAPAAFDARMNLGVVHAVLGRSKEAIVSYRAALAINAESPDAHYNLGLALMKLGDDAEQAGKEKLYLEALSAYDNALRFKPNFYKAEYNRALVFHRLERTEEEIDAFKQALVLRPSFPQALYNLAYTFELKERFAEALYYWRLYLKTAEKFETESPYIPAAEKAVKRLSSVVEPKPATP